MDKTEAIKEIKQKTVVARLESDHSATDVVKLSDVLEILDNLEVPEVEPAEAQKASSTTASK